MKIRNNIIRWIGERINQYQGKTPLDDLYYILTSLYYKNLRD